MISTPPHALSFDVEEWFHACRLDVPRRRWSEMPSRLEQPLRTILNLLERFDTRATFFVLGWTATAQPQLVRAIAAAGHEIASHGYSHVPVFEQSRPEFVEDIRESKAVLEDLACATVIGYRAPRYSIMDESSWALDELLAAGYRYDSSIYPARAPHGAYGSSGASPSPTEVRPDFWEFPLATVEVLGLRMPAATGAYLRLMPLCVTEFALRQNRRRHVPAVVNIHPWELDAEQPRWPTSWRSAAVHYANLAGTERKLARLLEQHRFVRLVDLLDDYRARTPSTVATSQWPDSTIPRA